MSLSQTSEQPSEISNTPVFVEFDEGRQVLKEYVISGDRLVPIDDPRPTARQLAYSLTSAFLPAGFPHTVTADYFRYQLFDSLQAFSSSIAGLLASRAVLQGLGVGDADSSATGALILTIIQETFSRLACIVFAHRFGQVIEPECKRYRFLADLFNDAALCLDLLAPAFFSAWSKALVMSAASVLRALCGVSGGAAKATLSAHFAKNGNLAELNAKEASQETIVSLLGMVTGTVLVRLVHGPWAVWSCMIALIIVHLTTNYLAVCAIEMNTLNRQRACLLFRSFCESGRQVSLIPTPRALARQESILIDSAFNNLASGTLAYPVFASSLADFVARGGQAAIQTLVDAHATRAKGPVDAQHARYHAARNQQSGQVVILLEHNVDGAEIAEAFFHNLYVGGGKRNEVYMITKSDMEMFKKGLIEAGWKFNPIALLTGARARLGIRSGMSHSKSRAYNGSYEKEQPHQEL